MRTKRAYLGIYGNTNLGKEFCRDCDAFAFVLDGKLACCDRRAVRISEFAKREICPEQKRRKPPVAKQREQLAAQNNCCIYCERELGSYAFRGITPIKLEVCWDHVVPYAYAQDNRPVNFVAACVICNGIKSDTLYPSLEIARLHIRKAWAKKGIV